MPRNVSLGPLGSNPYYASLMSVKERDSLFQASPIMVGSQAASSFCTSEDLTTGKRSTCALRISKYPDASLRVVRFLPTFGNSIMMEPTGFRTKSQEVVTTNVYRAKEGRISDALLNQFQSLT
ncbi:hypothetical protein U1Q18_009054 [Sarracenia purpurea var. burkii]